MSYILLKRKGGGFSIYTSYDQLLKIVECSKKNYPLLNQINTKETTRFKEKQIPILYAELRNIGYSGQMMNLLERFFEDTIEIIFEPEILPE